MLGDTKNKFLYTRTRVIYQMFWRCVATCGCSYIAEGCPSKIIWNIYFEICRTPAKPVMMVSPKCAKGTKWQQIRMHYCAEIHAFIKNRQTIYANTLTYFFQNLKNDFLLGSNVTFNKYFPLRKMGSSIYTDRDHSWQGNLISPFFWGLMVSLRTIFSVTIFLVFCFFVFSKTNTFSNDCASLKAKTNL